jgi:hypothetical protein
MKIKFEKIEEKEEGKYLLAIGVLLILNLASIATAGFGLIS